MDRDQIRTRLAPAVLKTPDEPTVIVETPDGPVLMTEAQVMSVASCARLMQADGLEPTWHLNECGCCVSVHPLDDGTHGWVIGRNGGADWIEHAN